VSALRERDYRATLAFVGEAHDAQDREELRSILLPGLRRLVSCDYASYNELAGVESLVAIAEPELPAWCFPAWEEHAGENPLLRRFLRTRDGRALRFSDIGAAAELRRLPLFGELYRPLGIDHQIAFVLPSTPELTIAVVLSRGRRDFSDRDRDLLELTRPHLIQAYRAAELRERLAAILAGLSTGLEADDTAIVLLDGRGAVRFASAAARRLIEVELESPLPDGALPPEPLAAWLRRGEPYGSFAIPGSADSLLTRRIKSGDGAVLLLERAGRALSVDTLRQLGLTPRESAVLHGLARGGDTDNVAADLGIAERTLAKHLQRIHAKLGVSSRAQAVATAWAAAGRPRG
jgi:DNA-binding CsgD family transcriptional regulator